jgi:hypothetical protein
MGNRKEDWHIHSLYSRDSMTSPQRIVDLSLRRGLKRVCITDHNTIRGGLEASLYAKGKEIEVVVGAEIKTDKGEITGLWLREEIRSKKLMEVIKEIKSQGGKVLIPHPYGSLRRSRRAYRIEEVAPYADYIEIYNGRSFFNFKKRKILRIMKEYRLKGVSGSDAHFAFEIGNVSQRSICRGIVGFIISGLLNLLLFRRLKKKLGVER